MKANGHELYNYTFLTEGGKHNHEVYFLIAEAGKTSSIEVKSSGYKTHASLDAFCRKFSARIKNKYLIYTKDTRKEENMLYLPAYETDYEQYVIKHFITATRSEHSSLQLSARCILFLVGSDAIPVLPGLQRHEHGCRRSGIIGGEGCGVTSEIFFLFFGRVKYTCPFQGTPQTV